MKKPPRLPAAEHSFLAAAFAVLACAGSLAPRAYAGEAIPTLDIKRTCAVDQSAQNGIPDPNCLQQEEQAKKQLQSIWSRTKPQTRATCIGADADSPQKSYVDILTCVQMFTDAQ